MTLQEIKQWRSHLQASPHTLQRIDALIGMVEELRKAVSWCDLVPDEECFDKECSLCTLTVPFKAKYGVTK